MEISEPCQDDPHESFKTLRELRGVLAQRGRTLEEEWDTWTREERREVSLVLLRGRRH